MNKILIISLFFFSKVFCSPQDKKEETLNSLSMIAIKGGYFFSGGHKTKNTEKKFVSNFYICDHKVTNKEYREMLLWCQENNRSDDYNFLQIDFKIKNDTCQEVCKEYCIDENFLKDYFNSYKYNDYPVVCTTYEQKIRYLYLQSIRTGFQCRLPHDYEIEFLALEVENENDKNGNIKIYQNKTFDYKKKIKNKNYNFLKFFNLKDSNNSNFYNKNKKTNTYTSYNTYEPNIYNIYDIVGNVFEQCSENYDKKKKKKIAKGAAFFVNYELVKIENKIPIQSKDNRFDVGFRCVIDT